MGARSPETYGPQVRFSNKSNCQVKGAGAVVKKTKLTLTSNVFFYLLRLQTDSTAWFCAIIEILARILDELSHGQL